MPEPTKSHFDRLLRPLLASRFITISAIIHLLIIILFGGKALVDRYVEPPDFQSTTDASVSTDTPAAPPAPPPDAALPPAASDPATSAPPPLPAPSMTALATMNPNAAASFSMPMQEMAPPTISKEITNSPSQAFSGPSAVSLPGAMAGRNGTQRAATAQSFGAKAPSEQAVLRALRWLQSQQQTDGSWAGGNKTAFTGLALLCFLGHGETPQTSHEFAVVVNNAINYLVNGGNANEGRLDNEKNFNGNEAAYNHAIGAYALSEAYTMTKDPKIEPVLRQAIDYILKGQRPDGGWAYHYDLAPDPAKGDKKSDTSVSGWQIQALKAAHLTGLSGMDEIRNTLNKSMNWLDSVFQEKDGTFGYHKPGDGHNLTGVGVLAKLFWLGRPDREVRAGLKNIESGELSYVAPECNLYSWYYDTQACFQAQGSAWDWWNSRFQDILTSQQSPDGSWPPNTGKDTGGYGKQAAGDGPVYRTTLCCLMLEVYYRYLPTSQDSALGAAPVQGL